MKILKSRLSIISLQVMLGYTFLGIGSAYAGFQESHSVRITPIETQPQISQPEKKAALEIFDDRYVPETVQKKYHLNDGWFDAQQPAVVAPTPLVPDTLEITSPEKSSEEIVTGTWRASKGEALRDVLQRWSGRSKIDLMWASPESPTLKDGFSFVGKYQDAVNELIKKEGGSTIHSQYRSEGLEPVMMAPASTVTTNTPPLIEQENKDESNVTSNPFTKIFKPVNTENEKPETRWFGLSGAPLAEVVKVWSEDAGVTLVWQAEKNFALQKTISHVGHFEDAVFKALSQYDNDAIRPVGEIYNDLQTGKMVLLVKTEVN